MVAGVKQRTLQETRGGSVMTSANNSRCYQGIQRVYRNAVVQHIRDRLIKAFEMDAIKKLREPFKTDEWVAIESAARLSSRERRT